MHVLLSFVVKTFNFDFMLISDHNYMIVASNSETIDAICINRHQKLVSELVLSFLTVHCHPQTVSTK